MRFHLTWYLILVLGQCETCVSHFFYIFLQNNALKRSLKKDPIEITVLNTQRRVDPRIIGTGDIYVLF